MVLAHTSNAITDMTLFVVVDIIWIFKEKSIDLIFLYLLNSASPKRVIALA